MLIFKSDIPRILQRYFLHLAKNTKWSKALKYTGKVHSVSPFFNQSEAWWRWSGIFWKQQNAIDVKLSPGRTQVLVSQKKKLYQGLRPHGSYVRVNDMKETKTAQQGNTKLVFPYPKASSLLLHPHSELTDLSNPCV